MSDIQDLIHKTSMDCLAKGREQERERIMKLLEAECKCSPESAYCWAAKGIALIKGEK